MKTYTIIHSFYDYLGDDPRPTWNESCNTHHIKTDAEGDELFAHIKYVLTNCEYIRWGEEPVRLERVEYRRESGVDYISIPENFNKELSEFQKAYKAYREDKFEIPRLEEHILKLKKQIEENALQKKLEAACENLEEAKDRLKVNKPLVDAFRAKPATVESFEEVEEE